MSTTHFSQPFWLPWSINVLANRHKAGEVWVYAWLRLPGWRFISWNVPPDYDERVVWQCGSLVVTRPETSEERDEREQDQAEAAAEDHELNRYTQWSY